MFFVGAQSFVWMNDGCVLPGRHSRRLQNVLHTLVAGLLQSQSCALAGVGDANPKITTAAAAAIAPLAQKRTSPMLPSARKVAPNRSMARSIDSLRVTAITWTSQFTAPIFTEAKSVASPAGDMRQVVRVACARCVAVRDHMRIAVPYRNLVERMVRATP
jgi:hypothetical protein